MNFRVQKTLLIVVLCFGVVLTTPSAKADAWGANMAAAIWTWTVNKIGRHIEGVMLGSLKMVAMNLMNSQIGQLIGGGGISGSPRFITNWQDALNVDPERNTQLYMNDFFTLTTRGMASSANYVGRAEGMTLSGSALSGGAGNYAQYLQKIGRAAISGDSQRTMTLNEFTASPEAMFREGDWRAFDSFVSNPMNNPYGYSIATEQAYQAKLESEKEIARTQAIAYQGFKGTEGPGGFVTTPGITIKGLMDNANDFGNKIIAGASNPSELAGSLASAAVSKAINGLVNYGVNQAEKAVMKPINSLNAQLTSSIREVDGVVGPAAQFMTQAQREAAVLNSGAETRTTNVGSVGACSGKVENDACMGSKAGTCKFIFQASGSDNGLRCLEGLDTTGPCPSGVRDIYGGCAVEATPLANAKRSNGEACAVHKDCASGICDYSIDKCIPQCANDELVNASFRCYKP